MLPWQIPWWSLGFLTGSWFDLICFDVMWYEDEIIHQGQTFYKDLSHGQMVQIYKFASCDVIRSHMSALFFDGYLDGIWRFRRVLPADVAEPLTLNSPPHFRRGNRYHDGVAVHKGNGGHSSGEYGGLPPSSSSKCERQPWQRATNDTATGMWGKLITTTVQ